MPEKKAQLLIDDQVIELNVLQGTMQQQVIDIAPLAQYGYNTFDPGFFATASCQSDITYIDGNAGILMYRGYPIEQLAAHSNFIEVCYLLLNGELPTAAEYASFCHNITYHSMLHEQIRNFYNGFRRDAHPMAIMVGVVGALSAFYHDNLDINNQEHRICSATRLIAKMPTIAAMCYKYSTGQPFMHPQNNLSFAENFLYMLYATPCEEMKHNKVLAQALDRIFILHADHEQNASTSTVRLAGSTGANPYACVSAGIGALWGPAHGGANEAALNMLYEIGDVANINKYLKRAKDPNDSFRLMGFGHRVYKNYDPRAKVMRDTCHAVLENLDKKDLPIFKLAIELEKIALEDEYFIARKLYPNIDFYCGITLSAIGIPANMFTVIFAMARTVGWIAQWHEMLSNSYRLNRPRQLYTGHTLRNYQALAERK